MRHLFFCLCSLAIIPHCAFADPALNALSEQFWSWRAQNQPTSSDDIPRIERPSGFTPHWSPDAVSRVRAELAGFDQTYKAIDASSFSPADHVDYRLIGSALARVHWELDTNPSWQRDPQFYLQQTLGTLLQTLLPPPPFGLTRSREIILAVHNIPRLLQEAKLNLTDLRKPFAQLAIEQLTDIEPRLDTLHQSVTPLLDPSTRAEFDSSFHDAGVALTGFRAWLVEHAATANEKTAIGRESYAFFLRDVALLPYRPEQLLHLSALEFDRSVTLESLEQNRDAGAPPLPLFATAQQQIAAEKRDELGVRRFLNSRHILTVPEQISHYEYAPLPAYLKALSDFGEVDDFTGPSRLHQRALRYIPPPSPSLGFFARSMAQDPRADMVHEGVPGHYFQMALSWSHPDPIRRHFYDSAANEGIGFYAEEMMLQEGYFDDSPRTREMIYTYMRLRALRVEVDVKLATGQWTLDEGAKYLERSVPMDAHTAFAEAAFFASAPGQAISYQTGKTQILEYMRQAREREGASFRLQRFHDRLWLNGNVPIALQQWEYLHSK